MQNTACIFDESGEISKAGWQEQSYAERLRTLSAFELDQEELRVGLLADVPEARPDLDDAPQVLPDRDPVFPQPTDSMRRRAAVGDYLDGDGAWLLSGPAIVGALWYLVNGEIVLALLVILYGGFCRDTCKNAPQNSNNAFGTIS